MRELHRFYIDGQWVAPVGGGEPFDVVNPATEEVTATLRLGGGADVDAAVRAAHRAFPGYAATSLKSRCELLARIIGAYQRRMEDMAAAISEEMGAPLHKLALPVQAPIGLWQLQTALALAANYPFEKPQGTTLLVKEPIGVCALITPWNWPMNQVVCKVAPALIAGCTVVLKPSELAPLSAQVFAEILAEAGVPPGVFNMIHGDGAKVGPLLASHPLVDMVSLTGSTRAGQSVAHHAADGIKVVSLELGGKSANIILDDAPFEQAVAAGAIGMMTNSGQSCNAPSRMLVPASRMAEAERIAAAALEKLVLGDPKHPATTMGPIANRRQFTRVQDLITRGIAEGARVIAGGPGRPEGLAKGFFAKPTVLAVKDNGAIVAREEIFGPVLTLMPYQDEDHAVAMANDTVYGLSGFVWGATPARALEVAKRLRTGMVHVNGAGVDLAAPFGGYKQSGVGREWGAAGLDEFLETKAVMGAA